MMDKQHFDIVFVVLVYKNITVLEDFFNTMSLMQTFKVIVVNSYYDGYSLERCRKVAEVNDADFVDVPNKGYGAGNNIGCNYALSNYDFDFLAVSNSDIIIKNWKGLNVFSGREVIIAPKTTMLTGKAQNPNIPFHSWLYDWCSTYAYTNNSPKFLTVAHIISRVSRDLYLSIVKIFKLKKIRIFSVHGSFFIISKAALIKITPIFNEKMFMYNEELYLAFRAKAYSVPVYYLPSVSVLHLEGASTNHSGFSWEMNKQSYLEMISTLKKADTGV